MIRTHHIIHRLLDLALFAPADKYQLFFYYSAHVQSVDIYGFKGGWKGGAAPDYRRTVYLDHADATTALEQTEKEINDLLA